MTGPEERLTNPFHRKWRRFKDAEHDMRHFKMAALAEITRIKPTLKGFREIEAYTGFHLFNDHPQTLQASFAHRLMYRRTIEGRVASENGASLVYSQGPTGEIAAILYPAQSDVARVSENLIFLRWHQRSAAKLLAGLKRDLSDLIAYELVTSLDGDASLAQILRVWWLRTTRRAQRDTGYDKPRTHRPITDVAGALGGKAIGGSVSGIFKFLAPLVLGAALAYFGLRGAPAILSR
jgi:hypothetical protein